MSRSSQLQVSRTKSIPNPNEYTLALNGEFRDWSFDEERSPELRGAWRARAFGLPEAAPLDLEIGTGNGTHFASRAAAHPERGLLGIELKYKPLIQSIRRARKLGCVNARISRYNAYLLPELFSPGEIDDVFIFFPDPWEKHRQHKHRLIQDEFLERLFVTQKPGSHLIFKTDSRNYYDWALTHFARSRYRLVDQTYDLHASPFAENNFITQFEKIFMRQGVPIGHARLTRD